MESMDSRSFGAVFTSNAGFPSDEQPMIDHPVSAEELFDFFEVLMFYNVSNTRAWHNRMEIFSVCTPCETYLYLWTMEQMV